MSDPEEMVSVPRWVLDELIPTALGALELLRKVEASGHPSGISDEDMVKVEEAIGIAYDAAHPDQPVEATGRAL